MADNILYARQGDTLDGLIARERGLGPANLDALFAANRGLADHGPELPIGTRVVLPATPPAAVTRPLIQLWD